MGQLPIGPDVLEVHTKSRRWSRRRKKHTMNTWRLLLTSLMCFGASQEGRFPSVNQVKRYVTKRTRFRIVQTGVAAGFTGVDVITYHQQGLTPLTLLEASGVVAAPTAAVAG